MATHLPESTVTANKTFFPKGLTDEAIFIPDSDAITQAFRFTTGQTHGLSRPPAQSPAARGPPGRQPAPVSRQDAVLLAHGDYGHSTLDCRDQESGPIWALAGTQAGPGP